jgi:hypothetical protein
LVSDFTVYLNEILLSDTVINIDDFSKDERIIHLVISQAELMDLFENEEIVGNEIVLEVKPSSNVLSGLTENSQFKVMLDWEPRKIIAGENVMLRFDILDVFLKDRPISVSYELNIIHDEVVLFRENGVSTGSKDVQNQVEFMIPEGISGKTMIKFKNLGGNELANLELPIVINGSNDIVIPNWVKNNAGWWADGEIPDSAFIDGIEFLIKEGIIVVPITESEGQSDSNVPDWVMNNAGWWADGQIDDRTFANGIQFLIKVGIISV